MIIPIITTWPPPPNTRVQNVEIWNMWCMGKRIHVSLIACYKYYTGQSYLWLNKKFDYPSHFRSQLNYDKYQHFITPSPSLMIGIIISKRIHVSLIACHKYYTGQSYLWLNKKFDYPSHFRSQLNYDKYQHFISPSPSLTIGIIMSENVNISRLHLNMNSETGIPPPKKKIKLAESKISRDYPIHR